MAVGQYRARRAGDSLHIYDCSLHVQVFQETPSITFLFHSALQSIARSLQPPRNASHAAPRVDTRKLLNTRCSITREKQPGSLSQAPSCLLLQQQQILRWQKTWEVSFASVLPRDAVLKDHTAHMVPPQIGQQHLAALGSIRFHTFHRIVLQVVPSVPMFSRLCSIEFK